MVDVYLCDFNDSFTYQIYSELLLAKPKLNIEVIEYKNLLRFFQNVPQKNAKIILGPGPGHPYDYQYLFASIKKLVLASEHKFLGICLGHQILALLNNFEITHCFEPKHGHTEKYHLDKKLADFLGLPQDIMPQRYNSLGVKKSQMQASTILNYGFYKYDELIIAVTDNAISFQFHPESIGTDNSHLYFKRFLEW